MFSCHASKKYKICCSHNHDPFVQRHGERVPDLHGTQLLVEKSSVVVCSAKWKIPGKHWQ
jgi:hypothetical protein